MQVAGVLRRARANGDRLASAVSGWRAPWECRRSRGRALWAVGFALGLLAVAGLVLALARSLEVSEDIDD